VGRKFHCKHGSGSDKIANGEQEMGKVVQEFFAPFSITGSRGGQAIPERKAELEPVGRACPECDMIW
jgi:hypothetical protein